MCKHPVFFMGLDIDESLLGNCCDDVSLDIARSGIALDSCNCRTHDPVGASSEHFFHAAGTGVVHYAFSLNYFLCFAHGDAFAWRIIGLARN